MKAKFLGFASILVFLFVLSPIYAQESKIWTDKEIYGEGDYIKILIQLPEEKFTSCETYLIEPNGQEIQTGSGGCDAGIIEHFDPRYMTEPLKEYKPSGMVYEFSDSLYLTNKFGTWGVKVLAKKDDQVAETLTTNFKYEYYNKIVGSCILENTKTKTCEFLGWSFDVSTDGGCGPNPVDINISYSGGNYSLSLAQGETDLLTIGLIVVRNMGSPCSAGIINLRFDKLITIGETLIKVSAESNEMTTDIEGETMKFSLPSEKTPIIEAKVNDEGNMNKIILEADKANNVLNINSSNVVAETKLPVIIEGSQMYVESNGNKMEVSILPDKIAEKVKNDIENPDKIEINSDAYSVKGSKDVKILGLISSKLDIEVKLDIKSGEIKSVNKPWWSFLAW